MNFNCKPHATLFSKQENSAIELINFIIDYDVSILNKNSLTHLILSKDGKKLIVELKNINNYVDFKYFNPTIFFPQYLNYIEFNSNDRDTVYILNDEIEIRNILKFLKFLDQYLMGFNNSKMHIFDPDKFLEKVAIIFERNNLNNFIPDSLLEEYAITKI